MIIFLASKQGASNHDIEDVISGCKDNEFCNACPDNQNKETNVVKRRRYRLNILKSLLLDVKIAPPSITFIILDKNFFSRCDSENCRALLARYDAPPAHDAANEESSSLQVDISVFLQFFLFYI